MFLLNKIVAIFFALALFVPFSFGVSCGENAKTYAESATGWDYPPGASCTHGQFCCCTEGCDFSCEWEPLLGVPAFPLPGTSVSWECSGDMEGCSDMCFEEQCEWQCNYCENFCFNCEDICASCEECSDDADIEECSEMCEYCDECLDECEELRNDCETCIDECFNMEGVTCYAYRDQNGVCGTANTTFDCSGSIESWGDVGTFCSITDPSRPQPNPPFPDCGSHSDWTCYGINGGNNAQCRGTHRAAGSIPPGPVPPTCSEIALEAEFIDSKVHSPPEARLRFDVSCYSDSDITGVSFATINGEHVPGEALETLPFTCSSVKSIFDANIGAGVKGTYSATFSYGDDCNKTVYFVITGEREKFSIPDSNIFAVLLALGFVSVILLGKRQKN